jgi:opacity protein-like surface antigen
MKAGSIVVGTLLVSAMTTFAQEVEVPRAEFGANYSYIRENLGGTLPSYNENGGSGYAEYNVNRVLGLVADFGANHVQNVGDLNMGTTTFTYLFGPRFNWRLKYITPYVQALVGGARLSYGVGSALSPTGLAGTQNSFAAAIGGGLDIRLSSHVAFKPIQIEYLATELPYPGANVTAIQNNLRYSAGLVFRFGSK